MAPLASAVILLASINVGVVQAARVKSRANHASKVTGKSYET